MTYDKLKDFFRFVPRDKEVLATKRRIYVALFAVLGLMAAYFMYVLSTAATIFLLLLDYAQYSFGLSWKLWSLLGKMWFVITMLAGYLAGLSMGRYFWRVIYIKPNQIAK
jgi:hypothetical protein